MKRKKEVLFLKIPKNFGGSITVLENGKAQTLPLIPFKFQRLYVKYLDCKAQTDEGIFKNPGSRKWGEATRQHYRRVIDELIKKGWATPCSGKEIGDISLRSYQFVWRALGIKRFSKKDRRKFKDQRRISSGEFYGYFKIRVDELADDRQTYYNQIKEIIHKKLAERKRAQLRWRLRKSRKFTDVSQATFSAKCAALLFGYRSGSTGSKLRKKNFSIVPTNEKPGLNPVRGRWEEPCKRIAL